MKNFDDLEVYASQIFFHTLQSAGSNEDSPFRMLADVNIDGTVKPVLLLGNVHPHPEFRDGHCIAILNPDKTLLKRINPGVGISTPILKEIVERKCDLMLYLYIEAYCNRRVSRAGTYQARTPSLAKYSAREIPFSE